MTINSGQPHRVGYAGQDFRVVVDEKRPSEPERVKIIGWMNIAPSEGFLDALNRHPSWSNARCERVTDKAMEGQS